MTDTGAPLADFSRSSRPICAGGSSRLIGARAANTPAGKANARGSDQGCGIGVNRRREIITREFRSA
jgi:hypothetical protein